METTTTKMLMKQRDDEMLKGEKVFFFFFYGLELQLSDDKLRPLFFFFFLCTKSWFVLLCGIVFVLGGLCFKTDLGGGGARLSSERRERGIARDTH